MDDEGFVVAALPPVVEAVRMVCESRRFHCGWPVYGPAGTGDLLTITSAAAKGSGTYNARPLVRKLLFVKANGLRRGGA